MYNRYIPQPDGSFRRNTMEDRRSVTPPQKPDKPPKFSPPPEQAPPPPPANPGKPEGIFGFLKQLLPNNLDTADLLIILLILLMAGDCEENRNNALLTLALYLFM